MIYVWLKYGAKLSRDRWVALYYVNLAKLKLCFLEFPSYMLPSRPQKTLSEDLENGSEAAVISLSHLISSFSFFEFWARSMSSYGGKRPSLLCTPATLPWLEVVRDGHGYQFIFRGSSLSSWITTFPCFLLHTSIFPSQLPACWLQ